MTTLKVGTSVRVLQCYLDHAQVGTNKGHFFCDFTAYSCSAICIYFYITTHTFSSLKALDFAEFGRVLFIKKDTDESQARWLQGEALQINASPFVWQFSNWSFVPSLHPASLNNCFFLRHHPVSSHPLCRHDLQSSLGKRTSTAAFFQP